MLRWLPLLAFGVAACASSGGSGGGAAEAAAAVRVPAPFVAVDMDGARHDLDADLAAGKAVELPLFVDVARREFRRGQRVVHLRVADDHGWTRTLAITLIGPDGAP